MQRKCGTCKYFEEGGIASSGWCRHPDRQDLEHMVLVRKTELACRQGWDSDLWEPRERAGAKAGPKQGVSGKGKRPASRDAMARRSPATEPENELEADRVVDMGIGADQPGRLPPATNHKPENSPTPVRAAEPPATAATAEPEKDYRSLWSSRPATNNQGEDQLQEETISRRFGSRREEWDEPAAPARPSVFPIPIDVDVNPTEPVDTGEHREGHLNGRHEPASSPSGEQASHAPGEQHSSPDSGSTSVREGERPTTYRSGATEQFDATPVHQPEPAAKVVENHTGSGADEEAPIDMDDVDDHQAINLPMLKNQSASCRNCRDFLPAKDGFGWCDNPFAFEQRRKVKGDEVACQSSFGSWWSPSDDWWMERADIAHHSAPTPLFDNLIRQLRTRYFGAEGSTEGQERS